MRYAELLAGPGVERGLIGPREVPRLWERHLLNCGVVAPAFDRGERVIDVGSGAGLPGIPLAVARPDLDLLLVEPLLRRWRFLADVLVELALPGVAVRRARAEDLVGTAEADVVTARAVAPLDRLAATALPLLRRHGRLVALKGERAEAELRDAVATLRTLGAVSWRVEEYGVGVLKPPTRAVVVVSSGPVREAGPARSRTRRRRRELPE